MQVSPTATVFFCCCGLILAVAAVFGQAVTFDFLRYDDANFIYQNPHLSGGLNWAALKWALSADFFSPSSYVDYWQPATLVSRILDAEFSGMNPAGHHLTNLILHAANAVGVFLVLRYLTARTVRCLVVALIFAVHPLQVETVCWVSARKDLLCAFFMLLTIWAYARQQHRPSALEKTAVVLLYSLSLMAKPVSMMLPIVLLFIDYWPLGRIGIRPFRTQMLFRCILEKIPLCLMAVVPAVVALYRVPDAVRFSMPLEVMTNAIVTPVILLIKAFWPIGLGLYSPYVGAAPTGIAMVSFVLLGFITWLMLAHVDQPFLAVGWLWYLVTLLPVLSAPRMGDRFMYVPILGLIVITVWAVADLFSNRRFGRVLTCALSAAVVIGLGGLARAQSFSWRDTSSFAARGLALDPQNPLAHHLLGAEVAEGDSFQDALVFYQEAVKRNIDDAPTKINLAKALARSGRYEEALDYLQQAHSLQPDLDEIEGNMAKIFFLMGRDKEAEALYAKLMAAFPDRAEYPFRVGKLRERQKNYKEAERYFLTAIRLHPRFVDALRSLGGLLLQQGRFADAEPYLRRAAKASPHIAEGQSNLGVALSALGDFAGAELCFLEAIRVEPENAEFRFNLGLNLAQQGRVQEAVEPLKRALQINPDYERARHALAMAEEMMVGKKTYSARG